MITYCAALDVPRGLAQHLGLLLRAERRRRGTRTDSRALTCRWKAMVGLRWFRQHADVASLATIAASPAPTDYRYLDEVIAVLVQQAPDLHDARRRAKDEDASHMLPNGKVFSCDRNGEKNAHEYGGNIQALSPPNGLPLWVSAVEPGSVHDLTAPREHMLDAVLDDGTLEQSPTKAASKTRRRPPKYRPR